MELQSNVSIDTVMDDKIKANTLSSLDMVKLTLANFAALLFPKVEVFIDEQRQNAKPPNVFIDFYEVHKQRKLQSTAQYEIGFTISYLAQNKHSSTELENALFLLQQNITDMQDYAVQSVNGDITDGIANITGFIKIGEINLPGDPYIMEADKTINI